MKGIVLIIGIFLYATYATGAPKELFKPVNYEKVYRLEDFNREFLREELFFSKRHRIIKVNPKVLDKDDSFTLTPFEGMEPLVIVSAPQRTERRREWVTFWNAKIESQPDAIAFTFNLFSYDTDIDGVSSVSMYNKFRHSEDWEINDSGLAVLPDSEGKRNSMVIGPGPSSEEDIEHHRKMKRLKRKSVQSLSAHFWVKDSDTGIYTEYRIVPLRFTPKYSVIFEIDQQKKFPFLIDPEYDEQGNVIELQLTDSEKNRKLKYKAHRRSLISEDHRRIMEDIE